MSRESRCEHDIAEQETAVAEHLCPLCLEVKVIGLAGLRKAAIKLWYEERTRRQEAEAEMEAVRELIPVWKEGDFNLPDYARGKMDGRHECAEELKAVIKKGY